MKIIKDMELTLSWQSTPRLWMATDDMYDGAEDSHPRHQITGMGKTKAQAAADYFERLEEFEEDA